MTSPSGASAETDRASWSTLSWSLVWLAAAVAVAWCASRVVPAVSLLVAAIVVGMVAGNAGAVPRATRVGVSRLSRGFLRLGIALLGFRLSIGDVIDLGGGALAVVLCVAAATFFGTLWLGRRLAVGRDLTLLTATGFTICGASAIAAVTGVVEADEQDAAYAIGLVTLCGTLCIAVLPLVAGALGMPDRTFGLWAGASVHDVGQVVATASGAGARAVDAAVVVKLTRVALLAPLVLGISLVKGRRNPADRATRGQPLIPAFILAFLAAVVIRSTGALPSGALTTVDFLQNLLLAGALAGMGTDVRVDALRRLGGRPLLLAAASWATIAVTSLAGVSLVAR